MPEPPSHVLLPLFIFPLLSFAGLYLILNQSLVQTGLESKISAICNPDSVPHPYRLTYTNIPNVDKVLCGMVVFFHALIDPAYRPLLAVLFPAVGVVALIPFLEASRDRRPFALRMPTVVSILFQLASMGVVIPLYALLFITTGAASVRPPVRNSTSKINQGNAEALLFGLLLGYVLPTTLMVHLVRPSVTVIWQAFPLLFAFSIFLHKVIRPPSRRIRSGHPTVVATLAFTFLLSALLHVVYVWPVLVDPVALRTLFVPVIKLFDPTTTSLATGVLEFIKWDLTLSVGSIILATLWMADSALTLVGILVWYGIANIAFGPAAAIAAVFLWREERLNGGVKRTRSRKK